MIARADVLNGAAACVLRDRNTQHGAPEDTFARLAVLWSVYLNVDIEPHDAAAMMALLKIARIRTNPGNDDNWIDLAGYAACGGEVSP